MLINNCYILIKTPTKFLEFTSVNNIEIESSWKNFTDTAVISLPRNINILNGNINEVIARGSEVEIYLGYKPNLILEFKGYVARVGAGIPLKIYCEDEMWNLKQTSFTHSFRSVNLQELIKFIYPGKANVIDLQLPSYKINKASAAQVLKSLKEQYGVVSYFQNGILNVGFAYQFGVKARRIYHLQKNVIEPSLEFKLKEDFRVKVKAISVLSNNTKIEVEVGDTDGEERTLNYFDLSKKELIAIATDQIKAFKVDGYTGDIKAFGAPFCQHGDLALIQDQDYKDREGSYFIDQVNASYGVAGFRRKVVLGRRAV
jgi:hypothetical protein